MKTFISSKEWFDDYVDANIRYTRCFYYSLDCELYYLEEESKKISASSIELKRKELVESKKWLKEYESMVNKLKRMNFIQRLLYKRGGSNSFSFFVKETRLIMNGGHLLQIVKGGNQNEQDIKDGSGCRWRTRIGWYWRRRWFRVAEKSNKD